MNKFFFSTRKVHRYVLLMSFLLLCIGNYAQAATYTLTSGQYPPCSTSWSSSGTTYTCTGNGQVTLANGDILRANTTIRIQADNGFSLTNNDIGTAASNINLQTSYGAITATGTNTINGSLLSPGSAPITLAGATVSGSITTSGNINLTGGSVGGLVTSYSNTITTNGTNLQGGATAQSGINITGGLIAGDFTMTSNNAASFSGVTMTSGSITGASTVSITNGSTLGGPSNSITISSNSGEITVNNSTVYGNLTAPSYSTVRVTNGAAVYGSCAPDSTPVNACTAASTLLGSWRMDEPYWNGVVNEVIDSSGKNNHGRARIAAGSTPTASTALATPAFTSGSQSTCSYGQFDSTSAPIRTYTYLELSGFPALPTSFTFTAWIRSTNASAQHQRILVRDDADNGWGLSLADGTGEPRLRFFNRNIQNSGTVTGQGRNGNCGVFCLDTNTVIVNNAWHFIAAAIDTSARTITLYVYSASGTLLARTSSAYSGTWKDGTGTAAIGGETSASGEGVQNSFHFLGNIDEVEIYTGALSQSYIESLRTRVRTCPPISPHHYELQIPTTSIACMATPVTVVACADNSSPCTNSYLAAGGTTANLSTSAGSLASSTVAFSNGGVASTTLTYPAATDGSSAVVTLSSEQLGALNARRCCPGNSCSVSNSCTTTFNSAGLAFATNSLPNTLSVPNQVAGVVDNSTILRAVKTNTSTGACEARITGNNSVQLAYECRNPLTCINGQTLTLNASNSRANNNNATIAYNTIALNFNAGGTATIPLNYSDVGLIRLHARLPIAAAAPQPAITLQGTSNEFVVKPYAMTVTNVPGNPGNTTAGTGFKAAGEDFTVQLEARNFQNTRTPNFGNEVVSERTNLTLEPFALVYPAGGTLGLLSGVGGNSFSATTPAGTLVNTAVRWNEVGSIKLRPRLSDNDYLGAGDLAYLTTAAEATTIGRFYPAHFSLITSTLANSCSGFTYMSQPNIALSYRTEARSIQNTITANYHSATYQNTAQSKYYAEENNALDLSDRLLVAPEATWVNGVMEFNSSVAPATVAFMRQVSGAPDGPFGSVQLGLGFDDLLDSRQLQNLNMNAATIGDCTGAYNCKAVSIGTPLNLRYGRMHIKDAFGSEFSSLPMFWQTEYWNGNSFVLNQADSCTALPLSNVGFSGATTSVNAASDTLGVTLGGITSTFNFADPDLSDGTQDGLTATAINFLAGRAGLQYGAPGAQVTYPIVVDLTAFPYLRYDWNQDGDYSDTALPRADIRFSNYRGHDRVIYWREDLQ